MPTENNRVLSTHTKYIFTNEYVFLCCTSSELVGCRRLIFNEKIECSSLLLIDDKVKSCTMPSVEPPASLDSSSPNPFRSYESNYSFTSVIKCVHCVCSFVCHTDPNDVARVESNTWIATRERYATVPHVAPGVRGQLAQWMSVEQLAAECAERFPGAMAGRVMYVLPFSMGPLGSPLAKYGVQLTDSSYVMLSMHTMTRVTPSVFDAIAAAGGQFVRAIHSVGLPRHVPFITLRVEHSTQYYSYEYIGNL